VLNAITIIILAVFLLLMAFLLLVRTKKGIVLSADNVIVLGVAAIWGILFPIIYFYSLQNPNNRYLIVISSYSAWDMVRYYVCIGVFLFFLVKTFRLFSDESRLISPLSDDGDGGVPDEESDRLYIASVLLFAVGVISDVMYCWAYGGYLGYLEYSAFVRSGITDLVKNPWSFLIVFRDCVSVSSFLLFSQLRKKGTVQIGRVVLFVASVIYSLMILFANRGRLSFLIYVVVFLMAYWMNKEKVKVIKIKNVCFVAMAFFATVILLESLSAWMGRTTEFDAIDLMCSEIAFCFSNFKMLLNEMRADNARFFLDIVSYPLFLLPSSLWRKIIPDTASDFMTVLAFGSKKGQDGVLGETPIDSVSIGYLQLGIVGVFVFAVFFGIVAAKLYRRILKIPVSKTRGTLSVYVMLEIFLRSLVYADSYNIVQRSFSLIVFALIYWGVGLFRKKRSRVRWGTAD